MIRRLAFLAAALALSLFATAAWCQDGSYGWDGERPPYWSGWTVEERHEFEVHAHDSRVELEGWAEGHGHDPGFAGDLFQRAVNAGFAVRPAGELVRDLHGAGVGPEAMAEIVHSTAEEGFQLVEADWRADPRGFPPGALEAEHGDLGQWVSGQAHAGLTGRALADAIHERVRARKAERAASRHGQGQGHGRGHGHGHGKGNKD